MILLGKTQDEKDRTRRSLLKKGRLVNFLFWIAFLLPAAVYFVFEMGLVESKSQYNPSLEKSVALLSTGSGMGSAFLVSPYRLLTAKHVVSDKKEGDMVELHFEKAEPAINTTAKIVWIEPSKETAPEAFLKDLAVLELDNPTALPEGYPYLNLGQSAKVGTRSEVILIGFPGGNMTTTSGSISNDSFQGIELFQLDVNSWPGSSGGPLILEETEEVIGMLIGGLSEEFQGINFANKVDNISKLLEDEGIDIYE